MGCSKSSSKREVHSNTRLLKQKFQTDHVTLYLKELSRKRTKPQIIEDRLEQRDKRQ